MRTTIYLTLLTLAVWQGYNYITTHSRLLDAKEQHLLILYLGGALAVSWIIGGAIRDAGKARISAEQYHAKLQLYEGFVSLWYELLDHTRQEGTDILVHIEAGTLKARMALHAGPEVMAKFQQVLTLAEQSTMQDNKTQKAFADLLLAMRHDLGRETGYFDKKNAQNLLFTAQP